MRIHSLVALSRFFSARAFALDPATLAETVRAELERRGETAPLRVELAALPPQLALEAGPAAIAELRHDARSQRLSVSFHHGDGLISSVGGRVVMLKDVPVLTRSLSRGETIAAEDLTWIETPVARAGAGTATELAVLIGAEARRGLRAGEPLRTADLRAPLLVRKGAQVTLTYVTDTMRLTLAGRALADGGQGAVVRVLNVQSSRVVEATIDGKDSAVVRAPDQMAAN